MKTQVMFVLLMVVSVFFCSCSSPGYDPNSPQWMLNPQGNSRAVDLKPLAVKPSGVSVASPVVPSAQRTREGSRISTQAVAVPIPARAAKVPTLMTVVPCFLKVASASYYYKGNSDPSLGYITENFKEGYPLVLQSSKNPNDAVIVSPVRLLDNKRGIAVYTAAEAKVYELPEQPSRVDEVYYLYDFGIRANLDADLGLTASVPRVGELLVDFVSCESYEQAIARQKDLIERQRIAYRLYLKSAGRISGYQFLNGRRITETVALSSIISEMSQLLEDIGTYSLEIGIDFADKQVMFTGNQSIDQEILNRHERLARIQEAIKACRSIRDDSLQRTIDKFCETMKYVDSWKPPKEAGSQ